MTRDVRNVNVNKYIKDVTFKRTLDVGQGGEYTTFETEKLAWARYLANKLRESGRINFYMRLLDNYDIETIKTTLTECFKTPDEKIRKSRAALFIYLLKQNDKRRDNSYYTK